MASSIASPITASASSSIISMSDNLRSCASCTGDLVVYEAEHRDSDQPSENVENLTTNSTILRSGSESHRKRFPRLRRNNTVRSPEEQEQKKTYRSKKRDAGKRVEEYIKNNSFDKMSGWLKFRCAVFHKMWIKFYCVLKPGILVVYKNENMERRVGWVGTILLSSVYIIERPTQREGFCFKLIHCLNKSLWVNKGPKKLQPVGNLKGLNLPLTSVIIRAEDEPAGRQWLHAMKSMCASFFYDVIPPMVGPVEITVQSSTDSTDDEEDQVKIQAEIQNTSVDSVEIDASACSEQIHEETMYVKDDEEPLSHLNVAIKSTGNQLGSGKVDILLGLARQIKPNQPLSRIVIPPFVNYPRSFLDKLQDMFYRVDLIAEMTRAPTPKERMELFAKFMLWLQNFHPTKEMKKYYNSILGERSRCYFQHPNGSRTHFIAEEVTHHPPASAIYCVNKQEGFHIKVLMEFEIRFHGYYVRTNVRGGIEVKLEKLNEVYKTDFPDLVVLNIFIGQFRIDFEGPCTLSCEQTGYSCKIENKTRWTPWGRENQFHRIKARLYDDKNEEVMYAEGHWNSEVYFKTASGTPSQLFWKVDRSEVLQKFTVHQSDLVENESSRLWCGLTEALLRGDEEDAILQKTLVEQRQRDLRATREQMNIEYKPALMVRDETPVSSTGDSTQTLQPSLYSYAYHSDALWDEDDEYQYEHNFLIKTHKRGNMPSMSGSTRAPNRERERERNRDRVERKERENDSEESSSALMFGAKQPSRERVNRYVNLSETLNEEQRFETAMKAQMNIIQRDLQNLHKELRTIHNNQQTALEPNNAIISTRSPVLDSSSNRMNQKVAHPQPTAGLPYYSIIFCTIFVIICVLFTYFKNGSSS